MCLREPSNRQVVRKADIATFMEHLRLQAAPCTTSECAKALLNSCFEPANAVRVADPASLSTICSILDNKHDEELQAALTNIIQSICLQVERAASLCCLSLTVWLGMSYTCEVPTSTTCTQFEACRYESRCSESCTPLQVCQPHQTPSASLVIVRALCTTAVTPAYFADLKRAVRLKQCCRPKGGRQSGAAALFQRFCVCSGLGAKQRRREQRLLWPICHANRSLCASYGGATASFLLSNSWGVSD